MAALSANDPGNESVPLRLKEQRETPASSGPGLAGRRYKSWSSRWERGGGGDPSSGHGTGWDVVSYLVSGMLAYGVIGWLVGRAVHIGLLFPLGMGVGLVIALAWVVYRKGQVGARRNQRP
jgi:hypothetical protein